MEDEHLMKDIKKLVCDELKKIKETGITNNNIEALSELIDIKKDIENIDYWKVKKEVYEEDGNEKRII